MSDARDDLIGPRRPEGPIWTTERGELPEPVLVCGACRHLWCHDWHYFYCRALGDQTKPGNDVYGGGFKRIPFYPTPHPDCRFRPTPTTAEHGAD